MPKKGTILILSAPSGCGKDTIVSRLLEDSKFKKSISMTTRQQRQGDIDGVTYHFVSENEFKQLDENGLLYESACYSGNYYGTPKEPIDKWLASGKTVILVIEVNGADQMRTLFPDAVSIFVIPPSLAELERRLRNRGTETPSQIRKRLEVARSFELPRALEYDYIVLNDDLDKAIENIRCILTANSLRAENMRSHIRVKIKS